MPDTLNHHRSSAGRRRASNQRWLVVASAILAVSVLPRQSFAWDFDEHKDVCKTAYQDACQAIKAKLDEHDSAAKARWSLACNEKRDLSDAYGQACAVAGDRVSSPKDLRTALGSVHASSDVTYYMLALLNVEHFQPQAPRYWLKHHAVALHQAQTAQTAKNGQQILQFEIAFSTSAFADHFLADSFAAGHMGFNRGASTAGAAKAYHDVWNENGRWVRSATDEWFARGDGLIGVKTNQEQQSNRDRIVTAETLSVREVLETFIASTPPSEDLTAQVWDQLPISVFAVHKPHHCYWFNVDDLQSLATDRSESKGPPLTKRCSLTVSAEWQRPFNGTSELDYVAQFSYEPYFLGDHGLVVDLRLGYGRELDAEPGRGTNHRDGLTAGIDLDMRINALSTSGGAVTTSAVFGVQSLTWRRVGPLVGLREAFRVDRYILQLTAAMADRIYDYNSAQSLDLNRFAFLAFASVGEAFDPRKGQVKQWESLSEVRMPAKYGYALAFSPMLQMPLHGSPEWDVVGQLSLGPYWTDMAIVRGFYLDLKLGYGREWEPQDPPQSGHRQGLVYGVDIDLPILRSSNGLATGGVVLGSQSLWWKRVGYLAGLRSNFYFGPYQLQLTAAIIDRVYDYEMQDGWGWNRFAVMGIAAFGVVKGSYPSSEWGVPSPSLLEE